ncbi:hypothetical protein B0H14DRAFT_1233574 [Mycena olivaceomarginata]|nr:hypothetical protein B0H14DRAFT_1233574 [Mycena olivaceomarginata]
MAIASLPNPPLTYLPLSPAVPHRNAKRRDLSHLVVDTASHNSDDVAQASRMRTHSPHASVASPGPADYLPLPPMNEYFSPVLAHASFDGVSADALPSLYTVFPATLTSPGTTAKAQREVAPAAAHDSSFAFTFTYALPARPADSLRAWGSALTPHAVPRIRAVEPPCDPFYTHRFCARAPGWGWGPRPMGLARRWAWGRGRHAEGGHEYGGVRGWRLHVPGGMGGGKGMRVGKWSDEASMAATGPSALLYADVPPRAAIPLGAGMPPHRAAAEGAPYDAYACDAWYDAQLLAPPRQSHSWSAPAPATGAPPYELQVYRRPDAPHSRDAERPTSSLDPITLSSPAHYAEALLSLARAPVRPVHSLPSTSVPQHLTQTSAAAVHTPSTTYPSASSSTAVIGASVQRNQDDDARQRPQRPWML